MAIKCKICGEDEHFVEVAYENGEKGVQVTACPEELKKRIKYYVPDEAKYNRIDIPPKTDLFRLQDLEGNEIKIQSAVIVENEKVFNAHLYRFIINMLFAYQRPFRTKMITINMIREIVLDKNKLFKSFEEFDEYDLLVINLHDDGKCYVFDDANVHSLLKHRIFRNRGVWVLIDTDPQGVRYFNEEVESLIEDQCEIIDRLVEDGPELKKVIRERKNESSKKTKNNDSDPMDSYFT